MKKPDHIWDKNGKCSRCDVLCLDLVKSYLAATDKGPLIIIRQESNKEPYSDIAIKMLSVVVGEIYAAFPCLDDDELVIKDIIQ
jgi:hypothetical protein